MKVFKLDADANRFQGIRPTREGDFQLLRGFNGISRAATWEPISVQLTNVDLVPGDTPSFRTTVPIFSLKAVEALSDLLEPNGELLPLACPDGEYFAFNVTVLPDVLDEEQSRLFRLPSGRIVDIEEYQFRSVRIPHPIFKLPQLPTLWVFVNEEFVERVIANDLRGFEFPPVWKA